MGRVGELAIEDSNAAVALRKDHVKKADEVGTCCGASVTGTCGITNLAIGCLALGFGIAALTSGFSLNLLAGASITIGVVKSLITCGIDLTALALTILGILALCGVLTMIVPMAALLICVGANGVLLGGCCSCLSSMIPSYSAAASN